MQAPFAAFAGESPPLSPLRARITAATNRPEPDCVMPLLAEARLPPDLQARATALATRLATALRARGPRGTVEGLVREYDLSSQEGIALMCLAEALLRIPDLVTRDVLIRDKVQAGDWRAHAGHSPSLFVNAATWGLVVTGRLGATASETGLGAALARVIARGGEPLIRTAVDLAMRMLGEQFVTGQTIEAALANSRRLEARGFRYSYDMLGEAAVTAADAARYFAEYEHAIHAIGHHAAGRGLIDGPGISVKLSALHPRYVRAQRARVMGELLPRLTALAVLARRHDIGLNIDAEEADRLDLSLDLLEALCRDPALAGWNGIGFVVQAYQKRAPCVIDFVIDLARRSGHRLMLRLVKGAYWDSEIKRAQLDGIADFPVFTRKPHTDLSYLACAHRLLAAPDAVFPQFATHNAQTLAAIHTISGENFSPGDHEFQCLHGMGEPLYEEVVGPDKLNRPCRIYAPVGTHATLLAYLVRRLLENGALSSFVNRIHDPTVPIAALVADPVTTVAASLPVGAPHSRIALPPALFGTERENSAGFDFSNEQSLQDLATALAPHATHLWHAGAGQGTPQAISNPADRRDLVGHMVAATPTDIDAALARAATAPWRTTPPADRAACLSRAADLLQSRRPALLSLLVREAGRTLPDAVAEIREAIDFLRYDAAQLRRDWDNATHLPLGPVACISPWNFPLSIFIGQVAAALAAGNPVLAKPAEQTPLIAAEAMRLLHAAGIPADALHLLPGDGAVGAALVADPRITGVVFTGSTEVARAIHRTLAQRLGPAGAPIPLIAETGGQNALVVDSSALAEQVVGDALLSAFDSAGQRCSSLRVLCLQDDVADRMLTMLKDALAELSLGNPDRLSTDIGPVISEEARAAIVTHIDAMRAAGCPVHAPPLPPGCEHGNFVAPTLIEIDSLSRLTGEVFGPVLHVLRFRRDRLDRLLDDINATGYALTFGVHSRIDETISHAIDRSDAGNIYVNRNLIGAVVGVQPFGGHRLSGTGPKAGGPLYLRRLLASKPAQPWPGHRPAIAAAWQDWLARTGRADAAAQCQTMLSASPAGAEIVLPGPVGESNVTTILPRGRVLCCAAAEPALLRQVSAALATGNRALIRTGIAGLPEAFTDWIIPTDTDDCDAVLFDGDRAALCAFAQRLAAREGPIIQIQVSSAPALEALVRERTVSRNTTASGGNATLMMLSNG